MALPVISLLKLATSFLPVIGNVLSAAAVKRGDHDLAGKITDIAGEVARSPGGLTSGDYAEVTIASISADQAAIEAAATTAQAEANAQVRVVEAVNANMTASLADTDKYRRRWRPTLAYVLAMLVGVGGLAIVYAFTWTARFAPDNLELVTSQIAALLVATQEPLRMILGLLGGAVIARSVDKLLTGRADARRAPPPPVAPEGGVSDDVWSAVGALLRRGKG